MANAADLALSEPVRMMIAGYPGTAKTGALAALANMGYKLRVLDFDGNYLPLLKFTKPEFRKNIDILSFEDRFKTSGSVMEIAGVPKAFADALKAMDHWKYTNKDGSVTDLGQSKDWGCDTVVVLDSLSSLGEASKRRAMALMNKTPLNTTDGVWGLAMKEQEAFIEMLTSSNNNFHVIVLAHLKMVGPNDSRKGDSEMTKDLKERIADLVPTRLFPAALGKALPPVIGGHFPTLILAENKVKLNKVYRTLNLVPRPELDLKVPDLDLPAELPISTGLADIFSALAPPLSGCADTTPAQTGANEGVKANV